MDTKGKFLSLENKEAALEEKPGIENNHHITNKTISVHLLSFTRSQKCKV